MSALCLRSKAHWGYDRDFLERSRLALRVEPTAIEQGRVFVAVRAGQPVGVCRLDVQGRVADLGLLFVDPSAIGSGVGARLFRHAAELASGLGCDELTILADPNATGFYEAMGATFERSEPSDAIPGRVLPRYRHLLARPRAGARPGAG